MWKKSLSTYREGDAFYIEFNTIHPYIIGKGGVSDTLVQFGVTYGVHNWL